jgi:hypothetical protein
MWSFTFTKLCKTLTTYETMLARGGSTQDRRANVSAIEGSWRSTSSNQHSLEVLLQIQETMTSWQYLDLAWHNCRLTIG